MATAQQPVVSVVVTNDVKRDGVLKEQVKREHDAKLLWNKKWNIMNEFHKIRLEEARKEGLSEEEYLNFRFTKPNSKKLDVSDWKYVSSEKFPTTSSGMIGWRSARTECSLERFGPLYTSPRFTIDPPDQPPTSSQKFIILG